MAKRIVYQLKGKTPNEVKALFIHFMGDKNATTKQIKDAALSNYPKIDTNETIRKIVKLLHSKDNIYSLTEVGLVLKVSEYLTSLINKERQENKKKELREMLSLLYEVCRFFIPYNGRKYPDGCAQQHKRCFDTHMPAAVRSLN